MLQISRADIRSDVIMDFGRAAFMKVPINRYIEKLGLEPISSQIALINAVNCPKYRFVCAALSRRQGKTYIANVIGQVVSLVPGANILIMSPNYSLSQISFELQRGLIKQFSLEIERDNMKDKIITLSNGSSIRMGSVNQVDSCVGRSYDLIIFDEAALADGEEAFNVALRPTLDKPGSKAIFISTPRGRTNWFARFWQRGFSDEFPEWCSIRATYKANPRMSEADIEEAKRSMSLAEFKQEYEADFNQFEGQVWKFDHEKCVADLSELDVSSMEIIAGIDMGARDPTAMCVIAYDWETGKYYIIDEYYRPMASIGVHAAAIQKLIDKWDIDYIFIDSAALQTRLDLAAEYDITTSPAKKSVIDGINAVSVVIEKDMLVVDQKCKKVLEALDNYQWDPNPNLLREKPKHTDASHMSDAIRYGIYSFTVSQREF